MLIFTTEVFNRAINNPVGTPAYTEATDLSRRLGKADKLAVQAICSNVSGTSPTLFVTLEDSADGVNWLTKSTIINGVSISAGAGNVADVRGYDSDSRPMLPYARFKIYLGGTSPQSHVQLFAVGRDQ